MFLVLQIKGVHDGGPRLLHRCGCQGGETDHIPHGIDVGEVCTVIFVYKNQAALPQFYANSLQAEFLYITLPASCDQCYVELFLSSLFESHANMILMHFNC